MAGGVAEWFKAAVSKTVVRLWAYRGFESHPLRQGAEPRTQNLDAYWFAGCWFRFCRAPRRGARVDDRARLESVCTFGYRGFESHPLRHDRTPGCSSDPPAPKAS